MAKFEEVLAPGVTIRESANDGSDFTNPTADYRRLFLGEDGLLHLKDSSGTVTDIGASTGIAATILDAKGDLIAASAADTAAKLTVGANDTILMADSGQSTGLKWVASQTPSTQAFSDAAAEGTADTYARGDHKHAMPANPGGGGGYVWLQRQTASNSAQLDFTGFISSTYEDYEFVFNQIVPATDDDNFLLRVGTGGGPTYDTGTNYAYGWIRNAGATVTAAGGALSACVLVPTVDATFANYGADGRFILHNPGGARFKNLDGTWVSIIGGANSGGTMWGNYQSTTALTAVRFLFGSGNISSGTIDVYGIKHA